MSKEIVKNAIDLFKSIPKEAGNAYKTKRKYDYKEKSLPYDKALICIGMGLIYKLADKLSDKDIVQIKGKVAGAELSAKGKNYKK